MWTFVLRAFLPNSPAQICDLTQIREYRHHVPSLGAAKHKLSQLIAHGVLPGGAFYQMELSGAGPKLAIAFYLFDDRRLCPVRIWNRNELFGGIAAGAAWMVDFNGLPPWSAIHSVEPRWRPVNPNASYNTIGRSARDWQKRNCWLV